MEPFEPKRFFYGQSTKGNWNISWLTHNCEFVRLNPDNPKEPPMCNFTQQRCTLCIWGRVPLTYRKARMMRFFGGYIKKRGESNGK